ncbi:MAG: mechanosensitive ion channel domain-containing protein [Cyanobacteria bacterium P01_A01_bin.135]
MKTLLRSLLAFLLSLALVLAPHQVVAQEANIPAPAAGPVNAPAAVVIDGKALLSIRESLGQFSAQERAAQIRQRILQVSRSGDISVESLEIVEGRPGEGSLSIVSSQLEDASLLTVTLADATAINTTPEILAEAYLTDIKAAITQFRRSRTTGYLLRAGLYSVITTLGFILLLVAFGFFFSRFHQFLETWGASRIPDVRIRDFQLLTSGRITFILQQLSKVVRFLVTAAFILAYLALILSFFPWTRQGAFFLYSYALSVLASAGAAFVDYIPNLFTILLVAVVTYYLLRLIKPLFNELERGGLTVPGFYPEWASPTYRLLELLAIALAAIVIFPYLPGFGSEAFQGIGIFIGVLVSLGSSSAVANAVAGVILIYTRAFQVGDTIQVNDIDGEVEDKLFLVTRIRTNDNSLVTIPNGLLLSGNIINYSASIRETRTPVRLSCDVGLGYDVPWQQAYETLAAAALETNYVLEEPAPTVVHFALGDYAVTYRLRIHTRYPRRIDEIQAELLRNVHEQCNRAGVEILSPVYSALRDGNPSTLPADQLPQDYVAPGFKVNPSGNLFQVDLRMGPNKRGRPSDRRREARDNRSNGNP